MLKVWCKDSKYPLFFRTLVPKFNMFCEMKIDHIALFLYYLKAINVVTFLVYGVDKAKAKRSKWRISEATLLGLAVVGGSIGALLGMKVWHHKTLHKKFKYGLPLILLAQIALIALLVWNRSQS